MTSGLQGTTLVDDEHLSTELRPQQAAPASRLRVLHVINNLAIGGAEIMLYRLLSAMDREDFEFSVISLMGPDTLSAEIAAMGIPVHHFGMKRQRLNLISLARLARKVRQIDPDVIHGWLYHGCLASQLSCLALPAKRPVVWGIHSTLSSPARDKRLTAAVIRICARVSTLPAKIIFVSRTSRAQHGAAGFSTRRSCVFPNGIDTERFKPSPEARCSVRSELGLAAHHLLVGMICRYHPMKDHQNFLRAAAHLVEKRAGVHFLLAGRGVDGRNKGLRKLIKKLGLTGRVHLLGERADTPRLIAALDLFALSSAYGESFPVVVAEAMSCGVPCVVTDIGDAAWIVGGAGRIVAPRDPVSLAHAWDELFGQGADHLRSLGLEARRRVSEKFAIASVAARYGSLYESLSATKLRRRSDKAVL